MVPILTAVMKEKSPTNNTRGFPRQQRIRNAPFSPLKCRLFARVLRSVRIGVIHLLGIGNNWGALRRKNSPVITCPPVCLIHPPLWRYQAGGLPDFMRFRIMSLNSVVIWYLCTVFACWTTASISSSSESAESATVHFTSLGWSRQSMYFRAIIAPPSGKWVVVQGCRPYYIDAMTYVLQTIRDRRHQLQGVSPSTPFQRNPFFTPEKAVVCMGFAVCSASPSKFQEQCPKGYHTQLRV